MKILYTGRDIQLKVEELAQQIESPDVMLCVLSGAFMFFYDLIKKVDIPFEIDFLVTSSYEANGDKLPVVQTAPPVKGTRLMGKSVVIVEDIIDSGDTISALLRQMRFYHKPKKVTVVSLLKRSSVDIQAIIDKYQDLNLEIKIMCGFEVTDTAWLVGYGLDDNGRHRTLPYIFKKS